MEPKLNAHLKTCLQPFEKYFKMKDVVEISVNKPKEVWVETYEGYVNGKGAFAPFHDEKINAQCLNTLAKHLATEQGQLFSESVPILATSIPELGYRVQIIAGSIAMSGFAMSIRIAKARKFPLSTYFEEEEEQRLINAIETKKTILIAGGTSSGKTTFTNSLIEYIPQKERIVVIEDTAELQVPHPNTVRLLKSKTGTDLGKVTYAEIIDGCMRFNPTRIIMGELDTQNVLPFLLLANSGHGGGLTTIHANDGIGSVIDAMVEKVTITNKDANPEQLEKNARKHIDLIVYLTRNGKNVTAKLYDPKTV